jgi:hypothetical protein
MHSGTGVCKGWPEMPASMLAKAKSAMACRVSAVALAMLQGLHQRLFIDHAAACHVDQEAARPQRFEHLGMDQVLGACAARGDDHQKIHLCSQRRCGRKKLKA